MRSSAFIVFFAMAGCADKAPQEPNLRDRAVREIERREVAQIGRFQFYAPNGDMPAILLDTATGCMESISKFEMEDGHKTPVWIRSVSDEVTAGTPKRCREEGVKK